MTMTTQSTSTGHSAKTLALVDSTHSLHAELTMPVLTYLVAHLAEPVMVVDMAGKIMFINALAANLLGSTETELTQQFWCDFLVEHQRDEYRALFDRNHACPLSRDGSIHHLAKETTFINRQGQIKHIELSVSFLPGKEPQLLMIMHDLSHHKAEYQKLHKLASTDALTDLANRRYFDETLHQYWHECTAKMRPISVVIIDIDYFKVFNDQFGHIQGDDCLRKVAKAIQSVVPTETGMGLAARYGGEEFALILPNHNMQMALAVARRVQERVNNLRFTDQGLPDYVSVSVSQGIASELNGQYRTSLAMLCAADTALYRAKSDGRDRINTSC